MSCDDSRFNCFRIQGISKSAISPFLGFSPDSVLLNPTLHVYSRVLKHNYGQFDDDVKLINFASPKDCGILLSFEHVLFLDSRRIMHIAASLLDI